ncbi:MAG: M23 family metallopeptidase [Nitrospirae bacterium]|nr:M23 family metallopeptidase [Nitrospirota bacterium]
MLAPRLIMRVEKPKTSGGVIEGSWFSRLRETISRERKKVYTLMVMPSHQASRMVQFKASRLTLLLAAGFTGVLLFSAVVLTLDGIRVRGKLRRLHTLEEQNMAQSVALRSMEEKTWFLDQEVLKVKRFDHKLRKIMNLEPPKEETSLLGTGGSSEEEPMRYESLDEDEQQLVDGMFDDFANINYDAQVEHKSLEEIETYLLEQQSILNSMPTLRPVPGWYTSRFGYRRSPYTGLRQFHRGIDMSNSVGTPIIAPADGVVVYASRKGQYGKLLVLDHGYGYSTRFGHLSELFVTEGQKVKQKQIVAALGNTGVSTGPHLHYEVRVNGIAVDPENFLLDQEN